MRSIIMPDAVKIEIGKIYKAESSRVLAGLMRIFGNLDIAEEALQIAFSVAMEKWPLEGIPANPYAWLISVGKFKSIDAMRREARGEELLVEHARLLHNTNEHDAHAHPQWDKLLIEDDQLRLIFYCCHPLLPLDARIALALREVCAMSTAEIARAYLVPADTIKKRISRAKAIIKRQNIQFEMPDSTHWDERLNAVLHVIYLIFNEGYSATSSEDHIRQELTDEAIFLCRQLAMLAAASECKGLLALLLLQESRRSARVNKEGDIIPLEEQDRTLWYQALIQEGVHLIGHVVMSGRLGIYTLQAAIASVHALADSVENTQWSLIIGYYDMLLSINPSPVVELYRAIAIGMQEGPQAGLAIIDHLLNHDKFT